ncbi:hypothetical protein EV182_002412 [Spiromyces aspiralis]|uniref:Uncharacterized protein n=1 Tax=Spiromyces aspiralis TaxID=68401 RepID=A0ACC1HT89_9FUNG|nr:hypothetical protein EV182_002412 [Spiromyces aspiralis]
MRIFVVPITRKRWAFHCVPTKTTHSYLAKWTTKAGERWHKLGETPQKSWRHSIYQFGERIMSKIDHIEWFFKEIPSKKELPASHPVEIIAPLTTGMLNQPSVTRALTELAQRREPYHRRWFFQSVLCVPLTSLFTLVPFIPNFPLFYNLFRLYSHYRAGNGAHRLTSVMADGNYTFTSNPILDEFYIKRAAASTTCTSESASSTVIDIGNGEESISDTLRRQAGNHGSTPITNSSSSSSSSKPADELTPLNAADSRLGGQGYNCGSKCSPEEDEGERLLLTEQDIFDLAKLLNESGLELALLRARSQIVAHLNAKGRV